MFGSWEGNVDFLALDANRKLYISFSSLCIILKIEKQVKLARRYKMSKVFGVAFKWLAKVCHDVSNQNPIQSQERTFIVKLGTI